MSETQILSLLAIGLYFLGMLFIGFKASRDKRHLDFEIGNRNVGYIPTMGSLATSSRDGMGIIFWFGFGATTGYGGLWLFVGILLSLIFMAYIGPKVRKKAKEKDYITVNQMIKTRFGDITERVSAFISIIFSFAYVAVQLYVSGNLFSSLLGIPAEVGVISVAAVVGFYLYFGGYSTVVKTDAVQFFLIIALIITPVFFTPPKEAVLNFSSFVSLDFETSAGLFFIGIFYVLAGGETWQRLFSARDSKVIRYSFPSAGVFLIIMTLSLIYLGMACAPFMGSEINAHDAFYQMFKAQFMSPYLLAFIAVVVTAVCMSTLDTFCYLFTSVLAKNIMPPNLTKTHKNYVRFTQISMVLLLIVSSILALTITNVVTFVFEAASSLFILAPIFILAAYGLPKRKSRKIDAATSIGLVISFCVYLLLYTNGAFENVLCTIIPALCSLILSGSVVLLAKKRHKERKKAVEIGQA